MLFAIKNREDLEDLEEMASLKYQVQEFRLQDKLGKQNYHEDRNNYMNHLLIQSKIPPKLNKNYYGNLYE